MMRFLAIVLMAFVALNTAVYAQATSKSLSDASARAGAASQSTNTINQGSTTVLPSNLPVATAIGPALAALAPANCVLSSTASGGIQLGMVGLSGGYGSTTPYQECNTREAIKILAGFPPNFMVGGRSVAEIMSVMLATQLPAIRETLTIMNGPPVAAASPQAPFVAGRGSDCLNEAVQYNNEHNGKPGFTPVSYSACPG